MENAFQHKVDYDIVPIPPYYMKMNTVVLILMAGMLLAIIVLVQTTTTVTAKVEPNLSENLTQDNITTPGYVEGELLVRFDPDAFPTIDALEKASMEANAAIGAVRISNLDLPGLELVLLPPGITVEQGIAYYLSIPTVMSAEANSVISILNTPEKAGGTIPPGLTVNNVTSGDNAVGINATKPPNVNPGVIF